MSDPYSRTDFNGRLVAKLNHSLPFRSERYVCTLYQAAQHATDPPFKLQEWFDPGMCVVLSPESYSGRILNEDEARTLLSAGSMALSHLNLCDCPVFIPVHDALRDAWKGVSLTSPNFLLRRFESDSIHGGKVAMSELNGNLAAQCHFLANRLRFSAAQIHSKEFKFLRGIASALTDALDGDEDSSQFQALERACLVAQQDNQKDLSLSYTVKHYYVVPEGTENDFLEGLGKEEEQYYDALETNEENCNGDLSFSSWDATADWVPWASYQDPIGSLELEIVRTMTCTGDDKKPVPVSTEWNLSVMRDGYIPDDGHRPLLLMLSVDQRRQFLELDGCKAGASPEENSFTAMLLSMCYHAEMVQGATSMGQLVTQEWWLSQGTFYVPDSKPVPANVLADAVEDIFQKIADEKLLDAKPLSPTGRLALHALRLGDPAAVASLWLRFLRQLRFGHWDTRIPLVGQSAQTGQSKERNPLLHQKLLTVALCIDALKAPNPVPDRPSQDQEIEKPELEGERALYMLESLSPAALYTQLLVVALQEALAVCTEISEAYGLELLKDAVAQFRDECRPLLSSSSSCFLHNGIVDGSGNEIENGVIISGDSRLGTENLTDINVFLGKLRALLKKFRKLEASVVAAHSLWIRLAAFSRNKNESIDQSLIHSHRSNVIDRLIAAAGRFDVPAMTSLTPDECDSFLWFLGKEEKEEAFRTEWVVELSRQDKANNIKHRLFIRVLPGEMRVATVNSDV